MYLPEHFRVEDRGRLFDVIRRHPLGLLILSGQRGLTADPVPFLVDESANVLRCHVARANPAWQAIEAGAQALVAFQGADHYVSPGWYPSKAEHHRVVPTWNYVSVQVSGAARTFHGPQRLLELVGALTTRNEAGRSEPWAVSDAPADFVEAQLRAIVGVEISIDLPGNDAGGFVQRDDVGPASLHDSHNAIIFGQNGRRSEVPPQGVLAEFFLQIDRPELFATEINCDQVTTLEVGKDRFSVCHAR